jgi:hypothetical protein
MRAKEFDLSEAKAPKVIPLPPQQSGGEGMRAKGFNIKLNLESGDEEEKSFKND